LAGPQHALSEVRQAIEDAPQADFSSVEPQDLADPHAGLAALLADAPVASPERGAALPASPPHALGSGEAQQDVPLDATPAA
jgi:hypothetical protein